MFIFMEVLYTRDAYFIYCVYVGAYIYIHRYTKEYFHMYMYSVNLCLILASSISTQQHGTCEHPYIYLCIHVRK